MCNKQCRDEVREAPLPPSPSLRRARAASGACSKASLLKGGEEGKPRGVVVAVVVAARCRRCPSSTSASRCTFLGCAVATSQRATRRHGQRSVAAHRRPCSCIATAGWRGSTPHAPTPHAHNAPLAPCRTGSNATPCPSPTSASCLLSPKTQSLLSTPSRRSFAPTSSTCSSGASTRGASLSLGGGALSRSVPGVKTALLQHCPPPPRCNSFASLQARQRQPGLPGVHCLQGAPAHERHKVAHADGLCQIPGPRGLLHCRRDAKGAVRPQADGPLPRPQPVLLRRQRGPSCRRPA